MDLRLLWDIFQTGGPTAAAVVLLWMWWLERKDRKAAEDQVFELATASIEAVTKNEIAVNTLTKLIERGD